MVSWLILTTTLIVPFIYWILTGGEWVDPKNVYNKLFENE